MAILPAGSFITLNSLNLYVSEVKQSFVTEDFDRMEFDFQRLRTAPNDNGQTALLTTLLGNTPAQIVIGPIFDVFNVISFGDFVRLGPDVNTTANNFSNIKKKFDIVRYEITGAPSASTAISGTQSLAEAHALLLDRFKAHQEAASSMASSYQALSIMQADTFSYLTTTVINVTGNALGGTVNNVLVTSFNSGVAYEVPTDDSGGYELLQGFTMTLEHRTISSRYSPT